MKRAWATSNAALNEEEQVCPNPHEGDERAQSVALGLASIADVDFIRSVLNAKASMDQYGGQIVIAAKRVRLDAEGRIDPEGNERATIAYAFAYQHVADALREETEPDSKPHQINFHENGDGELPLEQPPEDEPEPMEAAPEAEEEPVA